jgi:membrane protease YdiL (CAAX protease family)
MDPMTTVDRTLKSFIARRPLVMYFVLAYVFYWLFLVGVLAVLGLLGLKLNALPRWVMPLLTVLGSWMPSVAAVIVTGLLDGRAGIRRLFRKFVQFRLPARWYIAALIPLGLAFVVAGIYRLGGGVAPGGSSLALGFWLSVTVLNLLQGPTGEETGWRGFALPRLLERFSPLKAGVLLGVLWGFWHLPLLLSSGYAPVNLSLYCIAFIIDITSLSVLMTWIFRKTSNSLVPMAIAHFSFNAGGQLIGGFAAGGLSLVPTLQFYEIMAPVLLLAAVIVWAAGGLSTQSTTSRKALKNVPIC